MTNKSILTGEDILYMQDKVVAWNEFCGNMPDDKSLIPVYQSLTQEELLGKGELVESWNNGDMVGVADGIADLVFTSFFWSVLDGEDFSEENDWHKEVNAGWTPRSIDNIIERLKWSVELNAHHTQTYFALLLYKMSELMDVRKVFDIVCESNYSKIPLVSEVTSSTHSLDDEVKRIEAEGRYAQVHYILLDSDEGQRVVFKANEDLREDKVFSKAKIIKSKAFKDVVGLEDCIY